MATSIAATVATPAATSQEVMQQYQRAKGDTGSPEVQVALLTHRINELTAHFKTIAPELAGLRKELTDAKKAKTDRTNDVSKVLSAPHRKAFIDALTTLVEKADTKPETFLELAEQVDKMPADNFSYFLTLVRFRYAYAKK